MVADREKRPRSRLRRRHWAAIAAAAVLMVGGCAMYLSWGTWGVFVTCSSLTVVGSIATLLLLLPRSVVTPMLVVQVASCAVCFMLIGWGLVALLHPEYAVGWTIPAKQGAVRIYDEDDALWIGWTLFGLGFLGAALVITLEILPRLRRAHGTR